MTSPTWTYYSSNLTVSKGILQHQRKCSQLSHETFDASAAIMETEVSVTNFIWLYNHLSSWWKCAHATIQVPGTQTLPRHETTPPHGTQPIRPLQFAIETGNCAIPVTLCSLGAVPQYLVPGIPKLPKLTMTVWTTLGPIAWQHLHICTSRVFRGGWGWGGRVREWGCLYVCVGRCGLWGCGGGFGVHVHVLSMTRVPVHVRTWGWDLK